MQRIGFLIKVKPDRLAEYRRLHDPIWPELVEALKTAGMRNYSLWLRDDGTEFGYLECDDWAATCAYLATSEVHTRWQEMIRHYVDTSSDDSGLASQPVQMLEHVFQME